jgi:hypothetical protein
MAASPPDDRRSYILGHAEAELQRLIQQSRFLGDLSEHFLRRAGPEVGQRCP